MGTQNFEDLRKHVGHKIVCVIYSNDEYQQQDPEALLPQNVALECETCHEVLLDYDK